MAIPKQFGRRNTCRQLSQGFEHLNACRIVCPMAHLFRLSTAIPSVYVLPCLSNSTSDGSSIPLVDSYPVSLRTEILVEGYHNGFHAEYLSTAIPTVCVLRHSSNSTLDR